MQLCPRRWKENWATFDWGQRLSGKIILRKYRRANISCSQIHFLNSSLILQLIHDLVQSECLCTCLHYLDVPQYRVFLSFLGTWEITSPSHFRPMDHEQKWRMQLLSGGRGKCFCRLQVLSSLAKLTWKAWVRVMELWGKSSLIPQSQAERELPWRAAGLTADLATVRKEAPLMLEAIRFRWWAHSAIYKSSVIEMCTWTLYDPFNQCHPPKFNTIRNTAIDIQGEPLLINTRTLPRGRLLVKICLLHHLFWSIFLFSKPTGKLA